MKYTKQQQEEVKHFLEFLDIRTGIKNLEFSNADVITDMQEEIQRLNNIISELNNAYCKVITKCEEMIDNRFYMNDIAIKKYADEIKDICKYYVGEAKELKGSDK